LFFLGGTLIFSVLFVRPEGGFSGYISTSASWGSGGPISEFFGPQADAMSMNEYAAAPIDDVIYRDTLTGISRAVPEENQKRRDMKMYKIRKGDTLASVAAQFGVSAETIISANEGSELLEEKKEIPIPPVSGILYRIRTEDSLYEVARSFRVNAEAIKSFNAGYEKIFETPGAFIVIPDAEEKGIVLREGETEEGLPTLRGFFTLPAKGWNWGKLHETNAVDIANACGTPVFASAAGVIVDESSDDSWNSGYGNFILIEHENGIRTRYAHTSKNLVSVGDVVAQGSKIALLGNTGNTEGVTGCHVHFEVLGAKNPFALQ
jgi:murein DD-endopeptidase MepM/ murein hydrolase activator NlpD